MRTKLSTAIDNDQYDALLRIAAERQLKTGIKTNIHDVIRMALNIYIMYDLHDQDVFTKVKRFVEDMEKGIK